MALRHLEVCSTRRGNWWKSRMPLSWKKRLFKNKTIVAALMMALRMQVAPRVVPPTPCKECEGKGYLDQWGNHQTACFGKNNELSARSKAVVKYFKERALEHWPEEDVDTERKSGVEHLIPGDFAVRGYFEDTDFDWEWLLVDIGIVSPFVDNWCKSVREKGASAAANDYAEDKHIKYRSILATDQDKFNAWTFDTTGAFGDEAFKYIPVFDQICAEKWAGKSRNVAHDPRMHDSCISPSMLDVSFILAKKTGEAVANRTNDGPSKQVRDKHVILSAKFAERAADGAKVRLALDVPPLQLAYHRGQIARRAKRPRSASAIIPIGLSVPPERKVLQNGNSDSHAPQIPTDAVQQVIPAAVGGTPPPTQPINVAQMHVPGVSEANDTALPRGGGVASLSMLDGSAKGPQDPNVKQELECKQECALELGDNNKSNMTNSIPKGSETMTNGTHSNSHPRSEADLNAWESEAYSKSLPEGPNGQNPSQSAGADLTCNLPVIRKCSKTNQTASESNISMFPSSRLLFQVEPTPSLSLAAPARSMGGGGRTESPPLGGGAEKTPDAKLGNPALPPTQALELL